ncbi:hypothetical protein LTR78_009774 [Recurvomyces mirabilis]|uniref:Glycine zipper domain-containing protein n=1 Tax=Recurvomyces mirabilis TaxID=574656 RepID=A0AAE0TMM2_9PEZI|nr:hypothetical protein LTR78_009774 [Recurvomyces mirabilis]KAK5158192.1 hypothetical protein LTS14_003210 [Recurvomyces mirabilis]
MVRSSTLKPPAKFGQAPARLTNAGLVKLAIEKLQEFHDRPANKAREELDEQDKQAERTKLLDFDDWKAIWDGFKAGRQGMREYDRVKRMVDDEKERQLETYPGKWPNLVECRKAEAHPVKTRKPRPPGPGFEISQESDRGLDAALIGGAASAYLGGQASKGKGLWGVIGGALIGVLGGGVLEKQTGRTNATRVAN